MSYTVRRWLSSGGMLFDDSRKAKTAEEAIGAAKDLSGIFKSIISVDTEEKIRTLEPGGKIRIRKPYLKCTICIRRCRS